MLGLFKTFLYLYTGFLKLNFFQTKAPTQRYNIFFNLASFLTKSFKQILFENTLWKTCVFQKHFVSLYRHTSFWKPYF